MKFGRWLMTSLLVGLLASVGLTVAMARTPDPMGTVCEENAALLPENIPHILILNVTDEDSRRVPPDIEPRVREELTAALRAFPFFTSIQVVTNDSEPIGSLPPGETHVAELQLWLNRPVPARWFERTEGRMCGNVVLAQERDVFAYNVWSQKHELGHYFGLPHHDGTFMNGRGDRSAESDTLVACQAEILARWVPGDPYVPHWVYGNRDECAESPGFWASLNPFA